MTNVITQVEPAGLLVHLRPVIELTDDQLFELCQISGRWPSAVASLFEARDRLAGGPAVPCLLPRLAAVGHRLSPSGGRRPTAALC
jgi:hypothetical protein